MKYKPAGIFIVFKQKNRTPSSWGLCG